MSTETATQVRTVLWIDVQNRTSEVRELPADGKAQDRPGIYPFMGGETLCQRLLRDETETMVLARGPLPFFPGNKLSIGYISPLTQLPHYSFVGGHAAAHLVFLGLDAIVLRPATDDVSWYVVLDGKAPDVEVRFEDSSDLPHGQREAQYWLIARELGSEFKAGSVFTIGDGAYHGYADANVAVEGIFHAGRGGAGNVFARMTHALVLKGHAASAQELLGRKYRPFMDLVKGKISPLIDKRCARLGKPDTGTIVKMAATGGRSDGKNTMPSRNAMKLGYEAAALGAGETLLAVRDGHTACRWCEVRCRHYTWVDADYAPGGKDALLDDFEPFYSMCSMLDLRPDDSSFEALLRLRSTADERLFLPIEQMGCDVIDVGLAMAALFEGVEAGIIPKDDVPEFMHDKQLFGDMDVAAAVVQVLRDGAADYPAIRALGAGPNGLVELYPPMKDHVFTCGPRTLGNAGHCNKLWTFLMPFSRFFSHYSGQIYKIDEDLPAGVSDDDARKVFRRVIERMLAREAISVISNALSMCSFVFVIFTKDGDGETLDTGLLADVLELFGIDVSSEEAQRQAMAFIAQSMQFRQETGWSPPLVADYPNRIFEGVSQVTGDSPERCRELFELLVDEWRNSMRALMAENGYEASW